MVEDFMTKVLPFILIIFSLYSAVEPVNDGLPAIDQSNYYKALGVEESATKSEIKDAYRKKASKYHPDNRKSAHSPEQQLFINHEFSFLAESYEVLSDSEQRAKYDEARARLSNILNDSTFEDFLKESIRQNFHDSHTIDSYSFDDVFIQRPNYLSYRRSLSNEIMKNDYITDALIRYAANKDFFFRSLHLSHFTKFLNGLGLTMLFFGKDPYGLYGFLSILSLNALLEAGTGPLNQHIAFYQTEKGLADFLKLYDVYDKDTQFELKTEKDLNRSLLLYDLFSDVIFKSMIYPNSQKEMPWLYERAISKTSQLFPLLEYGQVLRYIQNFTENAFGPMSAMFKSKPTHWLNIIKNLKVILLNQNSGLLENLTTTNKNEIVQYSSESQIIIRLNGLENELRRYNNPLAKGRYRLKYLNGYTCNRIMRAWDSLTKTKRYFKVIR